MTYTGTMVLPQNAVMMREDEMRYLEGGFPWVPLGIALGTILYTSWDTDGKTWKAIKTGGKKYVIYVKDNNNKEQSLEILWQIHGQMIPMKVQFRRFKSFDELEYISLPTNAIRVREANSVKEVYQHVIPATVILAVLLQVMRSKHYYDCGIIESSLNPFVRCFITLLFCAVGGIVHELIHAVLFPRRAKVIIYMAIQKGLLFCYSPHPMSKIRYIVLSIAPSLILGIIPFIVLMALPAQDEYLYSCLSSFSLIMIVGGIVDFYNIKNIMLQTPQSAYIQMKGWETYWFQ